MSSLIKIFNPYIFFFSVPGSSLITSGACFSRKSSTDSSRGVVLFDGWDWATCLDLEAFPLRGMSKGTPLLLHLYIEKWKLPLLLVAEFFVLFDSFFESPSDLSDFGDSPSPMNIEFGWDDWIGSLANLEREVEERECGIVVAFEEEDLNFGTSKELLVFSGRLHIFFKAIVNSTILKPELVKTFVKSEWAHICLCHVSHQYHYLPRITHSHQ